MYQKQIARICFCSHSLDPQTAFAFLHDISEFNVSETYVCTKFCLVACIAHWTRVWPRA